MNSSSKTADFDWPCHLVLCKCVRICHGHKCQWQFMCNLTRKALFLSLLSLSLWFTSCVLFIIIITVFVLFFNRQLETVFVWLFVCLTIKWVRCCRCYFLTHIILCHHRDIRLNLVDDFTHSVLHISWLSIKSRLNQNSRQAERASCKADSIIDGVCKMSTSSADNMSYSSAVKYVINTSPGICRLVGRPVTPRNAQHTWRQSRLSLTSHLPVWGARSAGGATVAKDRRILKIASRNHKK